MAGRPNAARTTIRSLAVVGALTLAGAGAAAAQKVTIETGAERLTMINVMTPAPEDKAELLRLIRIGLAEEMGTVEGFQRAAVHSSADDAIVVVYGQWDSPEALQRAIAKLQAGDAPNMAGAYALGLPQPHPYTVEAVIEAK